MSPDTSLGRLTMPTRTLLQGAPWVPACRTDIRRTWARCAPLTRPAHDILALRAAQMPGYCRTDYPGERCW